MSKKIEPIRKKSIEALSPEMKIKTDVKIKIIKKIIFSKLFLFSLIINNAINNGIKRTKQDPKINSSPKKEETLSCVPTGKPNKLYLLKY